MAHLLLRTNEISAEQATVVHRAKDGKEQEPYDALEWLAAMAYHLPERAKQTIRHDGALECATSCASLSAHHHRAAVSLG